MTLIRGVRRFLSAQVVEGGRVYVVLDDYRVHLVPRAKWDAAVEEARKDHPVGGQMFAYRFGLELDPWRLMGYQGIADRFAVSRQRVEKLVTRATGVVLAALHLDSKE